MRLLFKQRGFALVAILTVALGIGVSTALFSVIDATMLRPLPYPHPEQLVRINPEVTLPNGRVSLPTASMADMRLWQRVDDVFSAVAGWGGSSGGRIVEGPAPERIQVLQFTEAYLSLHGVTPLIGRDFTRADTELSAPPVVLLGLRFLAHSLRRPNGHRRHDHSPRRWFGHSGRCAAASFNASVPLSRPLKSPSDEFTRRGTGRVSVIGRLRPDVTIDQARDRLAARMAAEPGRALRGRRTVSH